MLASWLWLLSPAWLMAALGLCPRRRKTWQQVWAAAEFQSAHPSSTQTMRTTTRMTRRMTCRTPTPPSGQPQLCKAGG